LILLVAAFKHCNGQPLLDTETTPSKNSEDTVESTQRGACARRCRGKRSGFRTFAFDPF
jgi:hypothetical protein